MKTLLLTFVLAAGSAAAQGVNEVFLDATYLGAPTEWCPANAGVPVIVKMDGPDIIEGPQKPPKTVRERVGGKVRIVHIGENTASFWNDVDVDHKVIGRFAAEFITCHSLWKNSRVTGNWRLIGPEGSDLEAGVFEKAFVSNFQLPFFRSVRGARRVSYAKFGDRFLHTSNPPEITTTQTFAAEPDKE